MANYGPVDYVGEGGPLKPLPAQIIAAERLGQMDAEFNATKQRIWRNIEQTLFVGCSPTLLSRRDGCWHSKERIAECACQCHTEVSLEVV